MSRSLTVLQTLPALHSGGVERGTLEIAKALVEAGHRSIVVSHGGPMVEQLVREGSEHILMPVHRKSLASLFQIRPFRRLLRELKPDIVHARSRIPAWIAWLALRRMNPATRPRFVTTVHGLYSVSPYSAIMARGEHVILISKAVQDYVATHYPFCPPERQTLIYRGADTQDFPYGHTPSAEWLTQWQAEQPQLAGKRVLAMIGRIAPVKGIEDFLELIAAVAPTHTDIHALVIGGAEPARAAYADTLKVRAETLGISHLVSFIGQRNDVADVLSQCDVLFSLRTTPEAFGRSTLEPLRMGKPVIGWDAGGAGEILQMMYPFGAVSANQMPALIAKTDAWLAKPSTPEKSDAFELKTMCEKTLTIYESLSTTSADPQ